MEAVSRRTDEGRVGGKEASVLLAGHPGSTTRHWKRDRVPGQNRLLEAALGGKRQASRGQATALTVSLTGVMWLPSPYVRNLSLAVPLLRQQRQDPAGV